MSRDGSGCIRANPECCVSAGGTGVPAGSKRVRIPLAPQKTCRSQGYRDTLTAMSNGLSNTYPTVTVETVCPVDPYGNPAELRTYVLGELDRIIDELEAPLNTGLIGRSLARQLRDNLQAWPNVKVHLSFNEAYPDHPVVPEGPE